MDDRDGGRREGSHVPVIRARAAAPIGLSATLLLVAVAALAGPVAEGFVEGSPMAWISPAPLEAQTPDELARACVLAGGNTSRCAAGAVASRAVMGHAGLLAGLGSEIAGTATTLGTRVSGGPRWAFSGRFGAARLGAPSVTDAAGMAETDFTGSTFHAGAALGVFEGLRLMPTVGGFLSLDVFASVAVLRLPEADGFPSGTSAFTGGVRVGIFREGFTMPGLSVSASRRLVGEVEYGTATDPIATTVDPSVTSLRATLGKDLHAVELLAGIGWDEYTGDATLRVSSGLGGSASTVGDMSGSRRLYFGSAAMTFSILFTLSVEAGWATGFDPALQYSGAHDPTGRTFYGGLAARLTM